MAQRVTLSLPNPTNGAIDVNVGTAANPLVTSAASVAPSSFSSTKQEDTPATDGSYGSASLWVRSDVNLSSVSANRDYINPVTDQYGNVKTVEAPSDSAGAAIVPVSSTAVETGRVIKASAGNLYGLNVVSGASAGYVMVFNSATVPAAGAVTPVKCLPIAANAGFSVSFSPPIRLGTGISVAFSTTGPFLKTDSATAFISGDAS